MKKNNAENMTAEKADELIEIASQRGEKINLDGWLKDEVRISGTFSIDMLQAIIFKKQLENEKKIDVDIEKILKEAHSYGDPLNDYIQKVLIEFLKQLNDQINVRLK